MKKSINTFIIVESFVYSLFPQWKYTTAKALINPTQIVFPSALLLAGILLVAERLDRGVFWDCKGVLFEAAGGLRTVARMGGGWITDGVQR